MRRKTLPATRRTRRIDASHLPQRGTIGGSAMQQASKVAQKCTQSEPLDGRDGCPHRAGWRVRGGAGFGCRGVATGRRVRRSARKINSRYFLCASTAPYLPQCVCLWARVSATCPGTAQVQHIPCPTRRHLLVPEGFVPAFPQSHTVTIAPILPAMPTTPVTSVA